MTREPRKHWEPERGASGPAVGPSGVPWEVRRAHAQGSAPQGATGSRWSITGCPCRQPSLPESCRPLWPPGDLTSAVAPQSSAAASPSCQGPSAHCPHPQPASQTGRPPSSTWASAGAACWIPFPLAPLLTLAVTRMRAHTPLPMFCQQPYRAEIASHMQADGFMDAERR